MVCFLRKLEKIVAQKTEGKWVGKISCQRMLKDFIPQMFISLEKGCLEALLQLSLKAQNNPALPKVIKYGDIYKKNGYYKTTISGLYAIDPRLTALIEKITIEAFRRFHTYDINLIQVYLCEVGNSEEVSEGDQIDLYLD